MRTAKALRLLGWWKFRGRVRRQVRRMKTPKGAFLTLLGAGIVVLWIVNLSASFFVGPTAEWDTLPERIGIGGLVFFVLTVSGALTHRGLFLPKDEIERLFSAPVARSDLVRYRLRAGLMRNLVGSLFVAVMAMRRMPSPALAFVGVLVAMQTLPVVRQLLAIALGAVEGRLGRALGVIGRWGRPVGVLLVVGAVLAFSGEAGAQVTERLRHFLFSSFQGTENPLRHPLVVAVTRPFAPWAHMIAARDFTEFLPWFALCLGILLALIEVTARLPVDTRELSLETAASVAARIRRASRGAGAAATEPSKRAAARSIPWLFGRGAGGAVAWRKTGAILRRARGTFYVSVLVLLFVAFVSQALGSEAPGWARGLIFAGAGTIYLCAGLRFDFRDELDRMEVVKAWPLAPAKLFLAMLLPEVCLVSALLVVGVLLQAAYGHDLDVRSLGVALAIPCVVLAWVALDNAVFLFAPVRVIPGQEGVLQNAGRGVVVFFLRLLALALVAVAGGAGFFLVSMAVQRLMGGTREAAITAGSGALLLALLGMDALLVWIGGRVLSRFDVARDR